MSDKDYSDCLEPGRPPAARRSRGAYHGLLVAFEQSGLPSARVTLEMDAKSLQAGLIKTLSRARSETPDAFKDIKAVKSGSDVYLVRED